MVMLTRRSKSGFARGAGSALRGGVAALVLTLAFASASGAGSYCPPGGPHPLFHGGDNQATYPPITTVAVETQAAGAPAVRLAITCHPNPSRGAVTFRAHARTGV